MDYQVEIDQIDVEILQNLLKDARTSFTTIARDCGVSVNTIVKRFYRMKKAGVITGTSLRVNIKDLGYDYRLSIDINVEGGEELKIIEALKKEPVFIIAYQVVGRYNVHAVVYAKTFSQIANIRHWIRNMEGVKRVGLTAPYDGGLYTENLLIQPSESVKSG